MNSKKKVGFTTSFPVEVVFAAGYVPVDLNNIFINNDPVGLVEQAEVNGYPRNICAWIKGMYSTIINNNFEIIVGIVQGDCSNTHSLMSTLHDKGLEIIPFSFPYDKSGKELKCGIEKLEEIFGVSHSMVLEVKSNLDRIRRKLIRLDELTYIDNKVTGFENHLWLVSSSDFNGDPHKFEIELDDFIREAENRKSLKFNFRFAFLGVPPIFTDIYDYLLEMNSNVVFNEIQRQFSMPYLEPDIVDQYLKFTYPYSVFNRISDVQQQLSLRKIDGVISYVQSFCHRQIDNILLKKNINLPVLTVEGDQPGKLDARTKLRIESFIDMLEQ
ncbi:MAG: 2-hydroxyacyl-CoA dehydratase [Candidatus Cloacimonetes bacterium]|nr:2-hydroxyacyl-CoA dehydratase [Candidatus Cloacimonadota bacterium]